MKWKFLLPRRRKKWKERKRKTRNIIGVRGWKAAALAINFSKIRNWFCADSSESFRKQVRSEKDIHNCTAVTERKEKKN